MRLGLDQLWWVVTPGNPLKANNGLPPAAERIAWCERLAADNRMHVTSFEDELGTPYTAATLAYLVRRHRDVRFVWIMGADYLASFHHWQRWRDIARSVPIAVVDRPGWRHRALASTAAQWMRRSYVPEQQAGLLPLMQAPAWTFLTGPLSRLSSTELRRAARAIAEQKSAASSRPCSAARQA
jgi:nicotinate-nucleotide adenylyltransferase